MKSDIQKPISPSLVPAAAPGPAVQERRERLLTAEDFHRRREVPPEAEWFANISSST